MQFNNKFLVRLRLLTQRKMQYLCIVLRIFIAISTRTVLFQYYVYIKNLTHLLVLYVNNQTKTNIRNMQKYFVALKVSTWRRKLFRVESTPSCNQITHTQKSWKFIVFSSFSFLAFCTVVKLNYCYNRKSRSFS